MRASFWIVFSVAAFFVLGSIFYLFSKDSFSGQAEFTVGKMAKTQMKCLDLRKMLEGVSADQVPHDFPSREYLESDNWKTSCSLKQDMLILDSLTGKTGIGLNILISNLTDTLIWNPYHKYSFDTLNLYFNWAIQFDNLCQSEYMEKMFFQTIYNDALSKISSKLDEMEIEQPSVKYNFKFRYLRTKLAEHEFVSSIKTDNGTKLILYIIDQKFCYIFHRFWEGTSWMFKLILVFPVAITLYAYLLLFRRILSKK